jgi:hypothetical protein
MNINTEELDLEFMEQEAEDHLSEREALLLGLQSDSDSRYADMDLRELAYTRTQ